jgi:hypothetical protein
MPAYDSCEDVWELNDFCVRENYALRSLFRHLLESPDTPEAKQAKLKEWRTEVATSLGHPQTSNRAEEVLKTVRGLLNPA